MKAWKRFRPVNAEQPDGQPTGGRRKRSQQPRTKQTVIKDIFGRVFLYELMSQIHLKLYNFSELEEEVFYRRQYKQDFTQYFRDKLDKANQAHQEDTVQQMREDLVPEEEVKIVEDIIKQFQFESDSKHPD